MQKKALAGVSCSRTWYWCNISLIVIVIIITTNAIDVHSFPLAPMRVGFERLSITRLWKPIDKFDSSNSLSRKAILLLKANRRDVMWGVVVETMLVGLSTTVGSTILGLPEPVSATDEFTMTRNIPQEVELVKGRITIAAPNVDIVANQNPDASLYITCRPDKVDSVPVAILNAYRGKAPPVLSVRLPNPTFPMDFVLKFPNDMTLEGGWDGTSPLSSTNELPIQTPRTVEDLWWNKDNLIVSARWDGDGVAATRSPDDLVGRGLWKFNEKGQESFVEIQLTGRGAFGKFATGTSSGVKK